MSRTPVIDLTRLSSEDDMSESSDSNDDYHAPQPVVPVFDRRQSVRQSMQLTADSVFARSMTAFCNAYFDARDRYVATPVHARTSEAAFCRHFVDSLCLLVGTNSAWIHDTKTREMWHASVREATTVDALTAVVHRVILVLRHPGFTKNRACMTTFFDGIDKMEERFG